MAKNNITVKWTPELARKARKKLLAYLRKKGKSEVADEIAALPLSYEPKEMRDFGDPPNNAEAIEEWWLAIEYEKERKATLRRIAESERKKLQRIESKQRKVEKKGIPPLFGNDAAAK